MTTIGVVGLGALGLPYALTFAAAGHTVRGADRDPARMTSAWLDAVLQGADGAALGGRPRGFAFASLADVVADADVVFVAVQTPSAGGYTGATPFPPGGVDYDLAPLTAALGETMSAIAAAPARPRILAVVSTVLPGTLHALWSTLVPPRGLTLAHVPAFAAVGRFVAELRAPEFVLIGADDATTGESLRTLFATVADAPAVLTGIATAELVKTAYNGFIGFKIAFANTLMEIADATPGCDVDAATDALARATQRLLSPRYLRAGLGDGGGCHPKENAALAALGRRLDLSWEPFSANLAARDAQTAWLARRIAAEARAAALPVCLLGTAFKADVGDETGSAALLLRHALHALGIDATAWDPHVPAHATAPDAAPRVFVHAVPHAAFRTFVPPPGSVVVDPWRRLGPWPGVRLVALGRGAPA